MSKGGGRRRSRGRGGVHKFNEKERTTRIVMNLKGRGEKKNMSRDVVPLRESSLLTSRQRLASLLHGTSTLQLFICDMDRVRSCYRPGRQPGISNSSDFIRSSFGHCPLGRCIIVRNRDSCGFHGAVKTHTSQGRSVTPSSDRLPHFPCDKRTRKTMF